MLNILWADVKEAVRLGIAPFHDPARQGMFLEHGFHGLEVEFRRNIHDRQIFIVESAVGFRRTAIALDQMLVEFHIGAHMAVQIHRHKPAELQETGVHTPVCTGIIERHFMNDIALKPFQRAGFRQIRHGRLGNAGINRPAHQRHR